MYCLVIVLVRFLVVFVLFVLVGFLGVLFKCKCKVLKRVLKILFEKKKVYILRNVSVYVYKCIFFR